MIKKETKPNKIKRGGSNKVINVNGEKPPGFVHRNLVIN